MSEIPGTVRCILCQAVISFRQNDKSKFELHLQLEHMVNTDTDIILAVCLMDEEEVQAVKNVMFTKLQNSTEESGEYMEETEAQTNSEVFSCENCKKTFKAKKSLRRHVLRKICSNEENTEAVEMEHDGDNSETETVVKTEFPEENITLEEDPPVSPIEDEVISCDNCKTIFKTKKILRRHLALRICLNKVKKLDEKEPVLKEVTDEDLARSKYFSDQKHPVITRQSSQAAALEFKEEEIFLPGWRIGSKKNGDSKRKVFLTPDKKWRIHSCLGVLEYLRLQGRKETELSSLAEKLGVERRRFIKLCSSLDNIKQEAESLTQLTDEDIAKSKYFSHELSKPIIRRVMKFSIPEFIEEDRRLPGWRIKSRLVRDHRDRSGRRDRKLRTFLTPGKTRSITTSTGVLEYLRLQGKQKDELAQVAQHLGVDKTKFSNLYNF